MELFKSQKERVNFFLPQKRTLDASEPGTGKTRVALEIFNERRKQGSGAMLVLAPKTLLEAAWAEDIMKFLPHLRYSIAYASNRKEAFEKPADIYLTNVDAARWLKEQPSSLYSKFDTLCIDEFTAFKHRTSGRSAAMRDIVKYFLFRHFMSGTPNTNSILDLWHPMYLLDDGRRLGTSFYRFRHSTCDSKQVGPSPHMKQWIDKPGIENAVAQLIADISMRHTLDESIPENRIRSVSYTPSAKTLKAYEQMRLRMIAEIENEEISAANAAVLQGKLLQITSGAVYSGNEEYVIVDKDRYELVADLVLERRHTLVFFLWKHQKEEIISAIKRKDPNAELAIMDASTPEKQRNDYVKGFQNGFFRTLLCHPKTAAHGLTLTKAEATIWPSPTSDLEWWKQGYYRTRRHGQDKRTETLVITAKHTLEPTVYEHRLAGKAARMDNLLEILKQ